VCVCVCVCVCVWQLLKNVGNEDRVGTKTGLSEMMLAHSQIGACLSSSKK
jgi:hypothetical protein